MADKTQGGMKKSIGSVAALATVAGTVIGSGVFFKAGAVTEYTGSSSLAMFVWLLAGFITICAGLTCAELAAAFPETGGLTRYIEHSYGSFWGFLAGWAQAIIYFPANVAALAIVFGTQCVNLLGISTGYIIPIAFIAAASIFLLNFISAKVGGMIQTITLIIKLIPLVLIIVFGFMHSGHTGFSLFPIVPGAHKGLATAIANGLLATMFAYDGWIHVGNIAGEMKNPGRDLPRAIAGGLGVVMVAYLLINAVFLFVLPIGVVMGNLNVSAAAATKIFGGIGGKIVTVGILISVYGTLNGYTMTGMRVPYIMGKEKKLPFADFFAKLNAAGVPWASGVVQYVIAGIMILSGSFNAVTNMLIFVIWFFYVMAFIGVIKLRRTMPDLNRPYKVPGYPIIPIIAILGGLFILVMTLFTQMVTTLIGIVATLIGIPFYLYLKKKYSF